MFGNAFTPFDAAKILDIFHGHMKPVVAHVGHPMGAAPAIGAFPNRHVRRTFGAGNMGRDRCRKKQKQTGNQQRRPTFPESY
jgi:hypothetical protein